MSKELDLLLRAIATAPTPLFPVRELAALMFLAEKRGAILSRDLARDLGIPKPSLSRLMDKLGTAKLAARKHGGQDGRDCWIEITPAGRDFVARLRAPSTERQAA